MLTRETMRGLYALPPTPFTESGELWEEAFRENLRTLISFNVDAIITPGSNGEWWSEDDAQRRHHLELLAEECRGKVVCAACTSSTYTEDSIAWTQLAQELGLDAVLNVPPFYYPLEREELRRYWHSLAEACPDIGLMIYNFPLVAQACPEDLQRQLADEIPAVCGSKESHRDFNRWMRLHRMTDLAVFAAFDRGWYTACYRQGAKGIFSTLVASMPGLVSQLHQACVAADWETAERLEADVWALAEMIEGLDYLKPYNPIAKNKALVNAAGHLQGGACRPPLISVPTELIGRLRRDLEKRFQPWLAPSEQAVAS